MLDYQLIILLIYQLRYYYSYCFGSLYTLQPRYDRGVPSTRGRQLVSLDRSLTRTDGTSALRYTDLQPIQAIAGRSRPLVHRPSADTDTQGRVLGPWVHKPLSLTRTDGQNLGP